MERFHRIGVIGLGLLGGSVALDVRRRRLARSVWGFSRRLSTMRTARRTGMIDNAAMDFPSFCRDVDFFVICTPVPVIGEYLRLIAEFRPTALVTDVASVKEPVVRMACRILGPGNRFVGSHPIAGSEKSGISAARAGLFAGRTVVVTPVAGGRASDIGRIESFWRGLDSRVVRLSPVAHDRLLALTSHLPHLVVFSLMDCLDQAPDFKRLQSCIGCGFLDTTRIGKSNPEMWADIFRGNRRHLLAWLTRFEGSLNRMRREISSADDRRLPKLLGRLRAVREALDG